MIGAFARIAVQHKLKSRRGFCAWILVALVSSLLTQPSLANSAQANPSSEGNAPTNDPPARVARISDLKGKVSFLRAGLDQWSEVALNFPATTGDRIYTDNGARAELEVGPYTIRLWEKTDVTITNLNDQTMQLGLEQGKLRVSVSQLPSGNTVEVDTPNGTLTLLAGGKYRVDSDPARNRTVVSVSSGSLEVSGGEVSQTMQTGQTVELTGQDPIQVNSVTVPPLEDFDIWSEERDQRLASSNSAKYVSPSTPGYDDLDTYGDWSVVAEYGPIWYPVVPAGWVPYRFGHWVWIDPWGWTWVEDEPWGFCPFHYGRWVFIGAAWGWLPGPFVVTPVYAPALVAFLGGPNFSVGVGLVGWFPLGPGEPYFPWYHHSGHYLNEVNVTNIRNVTNITNITKVTNINNVHYAYRTIATTAVPRDVLGSGKPVAHHMVRVNAQQLARAEMTPHPPVNPTKRAAVSGKPVPPPPIRTQHLVAANRTTQVAGRPAPAGNRQSAPLATKNRPPTGNAERTFPPPPNGRTQSSSREPSSPPRAIPPRLITRVAPPPATVPFEQRRPAMSEHPGRPLEPPQLEDLRVGRPVGPMHDREFPPHVAPVIPERPAPVPARPRFSQVKPK
jgi:hypothetical protein